MKYSILLVLTFIISCDYKSDKEKLEQLEKRIESIEELLKPFKTLQQIGAGALKENKSLADNNKKGPKLDECLKIISQDSRMTDKNAVYATYSWIINFKNSCEQNFSGYPIFNLLDDSGFIIHESRGDLITIPKNGVYKAKGLEMVSPASNADKISQTSASFSSPY